MIQFATFIRRFATAIITASFTLMLGGCVSSLINHIVAPMMHEEISANVPYSWNVRVISVKPPYKITSTSTLHGEKVNSATTTAALNVIARGRYRNWSWVVKAPQSIKASWRVWMQHTKKTPRVKNSSISVVKGWASGMRRLYAVTQYLLGTAPLPLSVKIKLVPNGHAYHARMTRSAPNRVPLVLAAWYPANTNATADMQEKRFLDLRQSLAVTGALLEDIELASGVTAVPATGVARHFKALANANCWGIAARPAVAAGTSFKLPSAAGLSSSGVNTLKATYEQYPHDLEVAKAYATALLIQRANEFLQKQNIAWPEHGSDVSEINALLGYCHAFLHYAGDIRKNPLPLKGIKYVKFFPAPSSVPTAGMVNRR